MSHDLLTPEQARDAQQGHDRAKKMIADGDYFHGGANGELDKMRKRIAELEEKNRALEIRNGELALRLRGVPSGGQ